MLLPSIDPQSVDGNCAESPVTVSVMVWWAAAGTMYQLTGDILALGSRA